MIRDLDLGWRKGFMSSVLLPDYSGVHPTFYSVGAVSRWLIGRGLQLTIYLHLSAEFKNQWSHNSAPLYAFMGWAETTFPLHLYYKLKEVTVTPYT